MIDVRPRDHWARSRVAGSISVDGRGAVATWVGWLFPIDTPVTIVGDSDEQVDVAVLDLHRIGFDSISSVYVTEPHVDLPDVTAVATATFRDLSTQIAAGLNPLVIDTREVAEWRTGHVVGAVHVPTHEIASTFANRPPTEDVWLHCAAGMRATIAGSQLRRMGLQAVIIDDAIADAPSTGIPWCHGKNCSDHLCTSTFTNELLRKEAHEYSA